jgi:hypothetical protein
MKKVAIVILFLSGWMTGFSQEVLLEKQVEDSINSQYGPNLNRYAHFYVGEGFFAMPSEGSGADIEYGLSRTTQVGYRVKFRITEFLSFGPDLEWNRMIYMIDQSDNKVFPNADQHKSERLVLSNAGAGLYIRFNFFRRGNIMGDFLDLGGYANWMFYGRHVVKNKVDDASYHSTVEKTVRTGLDYVQPYQYGLRARLGFNRYVIVAEYRLSDLFLKSYEEYPELSRFWVGFQFSLH